jgi:outer membrane protein OmpA-like peptidoglycan-associated protein
MRPARVGLLLTCLLAFAMPTSRGQTPAQAAPARDDIVNALNKFDTGSELDIPALKQAISERSKVRSKKEPEANKRPPVVPDIMNLPATFNVAIAFDVDTPIILPDSYETVGRIADAMVNAPLLPYTFLIVGHTESNGNRQANVILSQRRADAIRDVLANTFKISIKRLASLGVGEEQFIDQARPTSAVNQQIQIITVGKVPETEAPATPAAPAAAKKGAKKKK